jgi:hypothetical protein
MFLYTASIEKGPVSCWIRRLILAFDDINRPISSQGYILVTGSNIESKALLRISFSGPRAEIISSIFPEKEAIDV